jgi:hypothetical protein
MGSLGRSWTGRLSGGNTGRLHADLVFADSGVKGVIGLHDDVQGVIVLGCEGSLDGAVLRLIARPPSAPRPGEPGEIEFEGELVDEAEIRGTWRAMSGARGAFVLYAEA